MLKADINFKFNFCLALLFFQSLLVFSQETAAIESLLKEGKFEECFAACDNALASAPDSLAKQKLLELKSDIFHKNSLAFYRKGDFGSFTAMSEEAKDFVKNEMGTSCSQYTRVLNNLGFGYKATGQYKKANKTFREAQLLKEKRFEDDMQYARILNNLGEVNRVLNKFAKAEKVLDKSLEIKTRLDGPESVNVAKTLYSQALLYESMGNFQLAISKIESAIDILNKQEKVSQNLLLGYKQVKASLLRDTGKNDEAIALAKIIQAGREAIDQSEHSDYGKLRLMLANLYLETGDLDQGVAEANEALKIFEQAHGDQHPYVAFALRTKAEVLLEQGKTSEIKAIHDRSTSIIAKRFGRRHIEYFRSKYAYLKYLLADANVDEATQVVMDIDQLPVDYIKESSKYMSSKEVAELSKLYKKYFQDLLTLTSLDPSSEELCEKAMNGSLFIKGYLLESMINLRKTIRTSSEINELSQELRELNLSLENELSSNTIDAAKVESLRTGIQKVDAAINRSVGSIKDSGEDKVWEDLQFYLGEDELAIDFVRMQNPTDDGHSYAALVVHPDEMSPKFIRLFNENDVVGRLGNDAKNTSDVINAFYAYQERGADINLPNSLSLYKLIWEPLKEMVATSKRVYYAADGIMHTISLPAISVDLENTLADQYEFLRMTSLKNLATERDLNADSVNGALLMGGLKYGEKSENNSGNRSKSKSWDFLPWAEKEVNQIAGILEKTGARTEIITGEKGSEKAVVNKSFDNYRTIHIATHGYFETDDVFKVEDVGQNIKGDEMLTQSGLVLSKANEGTTGQEDNLWTAYEISQLSLPNTELVVLSACETGLGDIAENEGVYGLQRAFKVAGADFIIMSLWLIPDRETKEFMSLFYTKYVENENVIEAFNQTQKEMKDRFIDPHKWAGFVLLR